MYWGHCRCFGSVAQMRRVDCKIAKRCWRIGSDNEAAHKIFGIDDIDIGENGVHRLRQRLYQPVITIDVCCIDDRYPDGSEVRTYLRKELLCRQLERDIRLLVSINSNHIILLRGIL